MICPRLAWEGNLAEVQRLLREDPARIEERSDDGETALLQAAYNGHLTLVQWLLAEGGATIGERNRYGFTTLLSAAGGGSLQVLQWLLAEGGATIGESDNRGNTALLNAAYSGHLTLVQWLLAEGGATIGESSNRDDTLWSIMSTRVVFRNADIAAALSSFLRVALLLNGPPATFINHLLPEHQLLVTEGNRIRAALPRFQEQRRALVHQHCPLIHPLVQLVLHLSEPDNADMWTAGIGEPRRRRRAVADVSVPLRQSLRLKQQRRE